MPPQRLRGAALGLAAAATFGAGAPLSKLLLGYLGTLTLAGLLYLGAGLGLLAFGLLRGTTDTPRPGDGWYLFGAAFAGGAVGPVLMMWGLGHATAVSGSLLLNLEAPFTIGLAVALFGDRLTARESLGAALVVAGAVILSVPRGGAEGGETDWRGLLGVGGACLAWGLDNNLTQRLAHRSAVRVTRLKSLLAGPCVLAAAALFGDPVPPLWPLAGALGIGAVSYGFSMVLHMRALAIHGAARQAAYFATAPFVGALVGALLLREGLRPGALGSAALMAVGVVLLVASRGPQSPIPGGELRPDAPA